MITPNDIATKNFRKVPAGYSPEEVDTFLDDIYEDYERLYLDAQREKEPVVEEKPEPADDMERVRGLEKAIERTLTLAEAAAEETKTAAKAEAERVIGEARLQAQEILSAARTKAYELEQDINALENRYELMKTRVKLLLYAEIELLDKNEILAEKEEHAQEIK